jgi:ribonuclease BN (tRNA processing enzyme)
VTTHPETTSRDRIVLLGVDGGPKVNPGRAKPAIALVVDGGVYLVDCGLDAARQLVESGLGIGAVRHVFLTHQHLDHTSGLPDLVLHGWTATPPLRRLDVWGPPDVAPKLAGIGAIFGQDVDLYATGGGFGPFPELTPHQVTSSGRVWRVMEDDAVVVDATRVFHGPEVANAYAYRVTSKRSGTVVVFSGDTAALDANLVALARDCDVLVHEVQDNDMVDRIAASLPPEQGDALRRHLLEAHSDVRELPRIGLASGAKKLVFCHYTPIPQPAKVYLAKAMAVAEEIGYVGEIVAPEDLDVIAL